MHRGCGAGVDHAAHDVAIALFGGEIHRRRRPFFAAADVAQIHRLAEPALGIADQQNRLIGGLEGERRGFGEIVEHANAADRWRRQDRPPVGFVVERDIAGHDREVERAAGLANALQAADELAHDLRPLRIAEIEIVGDRKRLAAHGRDVAPGFGHRLLAALEADRPRSSAA